MKILRFPSRNCRPSGKTVSGNGIRFGFYQTRWGKRRRYRCQTCEKTFCSNTGTPYYRLQHSRTTFDQVATLSVEGLNKSAIARVERLGWNTVDRWLEKRGLGRRFNNLNTSGFGPRSFRRTRSARSFKVSNNRHGSSQPSRSGPGFGLRRVVGRRSYQNTLALFRDIAERANHDDVPLITTDGFEFYERVIGQVFGPACVYGQVIKTRRNNRIVKVERRAVIGMDARLEERLQRSEDSSRLNTSFIERLNLTIRQGSAYLCRRTICQARWRERLKGHLELLRCYYNYAS